MTDPCARCAAKGIENPSQLHAYWGPALCRPCAQAVHDLLNAHDKWPPVPWTDEDRELIP